LYEAKNTLLAYNIAWKLRLCLERNANTSILSTYESERKPVAQQLIAFDREYHKSFANNLKQDGVVFQTKYLEALRFTTGISIQYPQSMLVKSETKFAAKQTFGEKFKPGFRLPDFQMVNQSDAVPTRVHKRLISNGLFRILVFAGDISRGMEGLRLENFGQWFYSSGFYDRFTGKSRITGLDVEIITIHCSDRAKVELQSLHEALHPWSVDEGWSYQSVYVDGESYHDGHGQLYEMCGIDKEAGCIAVIRPDGYIGIVCDWDQTEELISFFADFAPTDAKKETCEAL
jgi:phenol 2-monooxygenase